MDKQVNTKLLQGTWIMAFAAVFSKILSAVYRVPLQNMVGDHGYYVYQQIYSIYGIFGVLSLTGLPLLISKFFSGNSNEELRSNFRDVFWLLTYVAITLVVVIQLSANSLAKMMGDVNIQEELQLTSLIYLLMPIEAVIRGLYQSKLDVRVSAISQVIEQVVRVTLILIVANLFRHNIFGVYEMGSYANFASVIAAIVASGYLMFALINNRKKHGLQLSLKPTFNKKLSKKIAVEGLGIILVTGILVFFQMIDSLTIVPELIKNGFTVMDAGIQKGIFDRAQPLAQLGIVIVISFLAVLVPAKESNNDQTTITRVLHFCIGLSLAETVGLILLIKPINIMFFKDGKSSDVIGVFLISIALYSLINILVTLNDSLHHKTILLFIVLSLVLKTIFNKLLIQNMGLMGASISTNLSLICLLFVLLLISDQSIRDVLVQNGFLIKTFVALIIMGLAVWITTNICYLWLEETRLDSIIVTFVSIIVGVVVYSLSVYKLKIFSKEDLADLPVIKRIIK
ncbi:sugar transporter [Companilactobacillus sp. RD055328]|uniref:oligosaccharide flippase family protein n=1 Tax=Companilactobacillus sp. RD055328 TaxID=2916634 RepID=UPI001FC7BC3B|nr:oligosaccharide flippase family protein [Companilactobacillus sp. RD055328]GKQ42288.1 sugar transporter [Companilactobacillus sp. RD055328]